MLRAQQRLTIPLDTVKPSFAELAYSIKWTLSLLPKEVAKKHLKENIQIGINFTTFGPQDNLKSSDINPMLEILQQEAVPVETKNFVYIKLRSKFPLY